MAGAQGLLPQRLDQYRFTDWDDALLVRGLHAILKSEMLFRHFQFADAALAGARIALDAAPGLVLWRIRIAGVPNPTSADAQGYLHDLWGVPRTRLKFFEDYYVDRVRKISHR